MTHPYICPLEQPTGSHYLPLKRKSIGDDNHGKHQETNIEELAKTTTASDETQVFDSTEQDQATSVNSDNKAMKSALGYSSNTHESQLPPLPQVIRRASRPCLLQVRTIQRPSTRHVTPDLQESEPSTPRWHKQSYMLFLALRQHPGHAMARTDLIRTALELDKTISDKLNFPIVFGGRTPQNSASALLTNNRGRHFQSYRPSGSRTMHFRLAFEPADFNKAVTTYRQWMKTLIDKDWPLCFGKPSATTTSTGNGTTLSISRGPSSPPSSSLSKDKTIHPAIPNLGSTSTLDVPPATSPPSPLLTEFDEFIATRQKERLLLKELNKEKEKDNKHNGGKGNWDQDHLLPVTSTNASFTGDKMNMDNSGNNGLEGICDSIPWKIQGDDDYQGTSNIPTSWQDIICVRPGDGNNYGGGVYAKRRLPPNTPLGFYFGTPTAEDEFQLVKEEKGTALEFSLMYGRTVLDATDEHGQPFTDPRKERQVIYCPFHFIRQAETSYRANVLFLRGKIYNQVICWTKRAIQQNEELLVWLKCE